MTDVPKQDLIRYLSDTNTRVLAYHNQKELLAWGAVAFYFGLVGLVDYCVKDRLAPKGSLIAVTTAIFLILGMYVWTQLDLRRHMGHLTGVLPRVCAELIAMDKVSFDGLDWSVRPIQEFKRQRRPGDSVPFLFPKFIAEQYESVSKVHHRARLLLEIFPLLLMLATCVFLVKVIVDSSLPTGWKLTIPPSTSQNKPCPAISQELTPTSNREFPGPPWAIQTN